MLRTLRRRFILSHIIPLLVVLPLMGIALVYGVETQVVLANVASETTGQAVLIADLVAGQPALWVDSSLAQEFVERVGQSLNARVELFDLQGRLAASSDPADQASFGKQLDILHFGAAAQGSATTSISYSQSQRATVVDVLVPTTRPGFPQVGVIRLSRQFSSLFDRFLRVRYLVLGIVAGALVLGGVLGSLLAFELERPLRNTTQAVYDLAEGRDLRPLPEQGPAEVRVLARAVNQLTSRLHSLEEARRQLLANLVHELGRPLGAMRSATQALLRGAEENPSMRQELLQGIDAEFGHLQRLLDDLASLRDQPVGALELNLKPLSLVDWLGVELATWRGAALEKRLDWEASLPSGLPGVLADPDRLAQALGNLLSNAIAYTPPGGKITLAVGAGAGEVWIRVTDTGPGIPLAEQRRVFTPFYRGRRSGRSPSGMGLGLSIARDLLEAHGGRIELASQPGRGSQFTLFLPAAPAQPPSA